jgi:L-malate glycosyltransferase
MVNHMTPAQRTEQPAVLQLVHSNEAGGVEVLAALIQQGLLASGVPISTHVLYGAGGIGRIARLKAVGGTILKIVRERPQVLIAYQSTASLLVGAIGSLIGSRLRIVHQTALPSEVHPALRFFDRVAGTLGLYSVNIANSKATAVAFAAYPAAYVKHLRLIEHGLEAPRPQASRAVALARHSIPDDQPILLHVGRLSDQKAQNLIIEALPHIPRGRLALAGGGPNEAAFRALAGRVGVADRVHFLGNLTREQVADLYGAADLFVFPSVWETFGLAPVEAAMVGLPIVAADLDVLREVLSVSGHTPVRFVASGPATSADTASAQPREQVWAAAINASLADPELQSAASQHAVGVRAKYAEDRMVQAYVDLIKGAPVLPEAVLPEALDPKHGSAGS